MAPITDEAMKEMLSRARSYSLVLLRPGPRRRDLNAPAVIWEHGRRNLELREAGKLSIVCPVADGNDLCGLGIFNAGADETRRIMEGDPGVQAGIFIYEIYTCRSFPGDSLPR